MKKLNKNGFTLIELLAVIVIMGILMMVAIPAMTRYIENSRKDTFLSTAKEYVNAARNMWASDSLICNTGDANNPRIVSSGVDAGDWYIIIDTTQDYVNLLDQGGKSSWGNRDMKGYVRVHITEENVYADDNTTVIDTERKTKYYVALSDGTHGITDSGTLSGTTINGGTEADELLRADVKSTGIKYDSVNPAATIVRPSSGSGTRPDFADKSQTYAGTELHTCVEN